MNIFQELKARGLVFQTTDEEALEKALTEGSISFYSGYDPTADSLHLGHLVPILVCHHLQMAGHKPFMLVGGATGLIGDPSFKDSERSLHTKDTVAEWSSKIQGQLSQFLEFDKNNLNVRKLIRLHNDLEKAKLVKKRLDNMLSYGDYRQINSELNKLKKSNYFLEKAYKTYENQHRSNTEGKIFYFLGKTEDRIIQKQNAIQNQEEKLKGNLAIIVNNYDWFSNISFIDFLRDVGKYFTVNYMMSKDSVKSRIETGISYTEFAYQIMQGYDFYELNRLHDVTLQIGGSDQWGNMTAGTELLRRKAGKTAHVLTVPIITDSTGKKFGKSEGNAIWLDATKTSPYALYQYFLNVMDDDAVRFLKIFTTKRLEEIAELESQFNQARHERLAQKVLACEVVTLVHGEEAYEQALNITKQLFAGNIKSLSAADLKQGLSHVKSYQVTDQDNRNIVELLVTSGIAPSKRQAREDVTNGAISINGDKVQDLDYVLTEADKIDGELTVIRRGKKNYFVLTY